MQKVNSGLVVQMYPYTATGLAKSDHVFYVSELL